MKMKITKEMNYHIVSIIIMLMRVRRIISFTSIFSLGGLETSLCLRLYSLVGLFGLVFSVVFLLSQIFLRNTEIGKGEKTRYIKT